MIEFRGSMFSVDYYYVSNRVELDAVRIMSTLQSEVFLCWCLQGLPFSHLACNRDRIMCLLSYQCLGLLLVVFDFL